MPLNFLSYHLEHGPPQWLVTHTQSILTVAAAVALVFLIKLYTGGRANKSERALHGRVFIVTGGTSGIGAMAVHDLATRGAQLCLLTQVPPTDPFLVEYIQDLRAKTNNQLIYSEQVDLIDLHSVRKFATKWIDNAPPRRLDGVILCAAGMTPPGNKRRETEDGVEETWQLNYLANFHLLGILSPALRAQPVDRDVRIIMLTCSSYIGSPSLKEPLSPQNWSPGKAYARSKLALNIFGKAYQKHLSSYKRPDGLPMNSHVLMVDPGLCRTPGMRRWLSRGSVWWLLLYVLFYPIPWLLLKSSRQGAQSVLCAVMEASLGRGDGGQLIKECMIVDYARREVDDDEVAKKLWEESDALIERVEKAQAKRRALEKGEEEKLKQAAKDQEAKEEVEGLMDAIKKGKAQEQAKQQEKKNKKNKRKGDKASK